MPVLEILGGFGKFGETGPSPPRSWRRFTESSSMYSTLNFTSNEVLLEPKHHLRVELYIPVLGYVGHLGNLRNWGSDPINHEQVHTEKILKWPI